uniref:Uncharacterized protein n=1 Tax=Arion vulgaris TaxID=1028688 RepID=A0A0B7BKY5_9EUPU
MSQVSYLHIVSIQWSAAAQDIIKNLSCLKIKHDLSTTMTTTFSKQVRNGYIILTVNLPEEQF